jgi:hypothetical protein
MKELSNQISNIWLWIQARFRLDLEAVCKLSRGMPEHGDYHDYPDDILGIPSHFARLECKRCGKYFYI